MSLWICTDCTCRYSVGAERCPHCQSTNHTEEHPKGPYTCVGCGTSYRLKIFTCPRCKGTEIEETPMMAKITRAGGPSNADNPDSVPTTDEQNETVVDSAVEAEESAPTAESDEDGSDESGADGDSEETPDPAAEARELYESETVAALAAELERRGLPKSGTKTELVVRLLADDAARAAETEDTAAVNEQDTA